MVTRTGRGLTTAGREQADALLRLGVVLGTAAFLVTELLFTVSDALARGGSGGQTAGGGAGRSSLMFAKVPHVVPGGSSISTGVGILIVTAVVAILALTIFIVWRSVRGSTAREAPSDGPPSELASGSIADVLQQAAEDPDGLRARPQAQSSGASVVGMTPGGAAPLGGTPVRQQPDTEDQLIKLADLRGRGVLTDAEFEAQKRKLLGT